MKMTGTLRFDTVHKWNCSNIKKDGKYAQCSNLWNLRNFDQKMTIKFIWKNAGRSIGNYMRASAPSLSDF